MENDAERPPPWHAIRRQAPRWIRVGCFGHAARDLREILRLKEGKNAAPTAAILDGHVLKSGHRAGHRGHKETRAPRSTWRSTPSAVS